MTESNKHSSLLQHGTNYGGKQAPGKLGHFVSAVHAQLMKLDKLGRLTMAKKFIGLVFQTFVFFSREFLFHFKAELEQKFTIFS